MLFLITIRLITHMRLHCYNDESYTENKILHLNLIIKFIKLHSELFLIIFKITSCNIIVPSNESIVKIDNMRRFNTYHHCLVREPKKLILFYV